MHLSTRNKSAARLNRFQLNLKSKSQEEEIFQDHCQWT